MSLTSRANHLAKVAGLSHQAAVERIRQTGRQTAELAAKNSWPLKRCDVFLADPLLDEEYRAQQESGARYTGEDHCDNCSAIYFTGSDKKGAPCFGSERWCPTCIEENGTCSCARCGGQMLGSLDPEGNYCGECWPA